MDSVSDYYSATQLRSDRWIALRDAIASLSRDKKSKNKKELKSSITSLFQSLALIEPYWAFPGMAAFNHMVRQFENENYEDLLFAVYRVTRALTTGAYRRRTIPLDRDSVDEDEHNDEEMLSPEARAMSWPYFEVLMVDDVKEQLERWLKSKHDGVCRRGDT